jgi:hypothetical protein
MFIFVPLNYNNMKNLNKDVIDYAVQNLKDGVGLECLGADLHHELFNTDYFIIGYYESEKWLKENTGIFNAINEIQEYEKQHFGEIYTDLSNSEKVVNMWVYIEGERVLQKSKTLIKNWDKKLYSLDINKIIKELQA